MAIPSPLGEIKLPIQKYPLSVKAKASVMQHGIMVTDERNNMTITVTDYIHSIRFSIKRGDEDEIELFVSNKYYDRVFEILYSLMMCTGEKWINLFRMLSELSVKRQTEELLYISWAIGRGLALDKIYEDVYNKVSELHRKYTILKQNIEKKAPLVSELYRNGVYIGRNHVAMLIQVKIPTYELYYYGVIVKNDGTAYVKELSMTDSIDYTVRFRTSGFYSLLNLVNGSTIGMKELKDFIRYLDREEKMYLIEQIMTKLNSELREKFVEKNQNIIYNVIADEI